MVGKGDFAGKQSELDDGGDLGDEQVELIKGVSIAVRWIDGGVEMGLSIPPTEVDVAQTIDSSKPGLRVLGGGDGVNVGL